jgi:protein PhnA
MPDPSLLARADHRCELCAATDDLAAEPILPVGDPVLACPACRDALAGTEPLEPSGWFSLQQTAWSEHPAVQVASWRLLHRLPHTTWAVDLLDQLYLDEETLSWARAGLPEPEPRVIVLDANGAPLADGDSVTLIKDLDVKGTSFVAKRGTLVKGIRLTDDPGLVEGQVNRTAIYLKTEFLKRVG